MFDNKIFFKFQVQSVLLNDLYQKNFLYTVLKNYSGISQIWVENTLAYILTQNPTSPY